MSPVTIRAAGVGRLASGLFTLGLASITLTIASLYLPWPWANAEYLLSISMLLGGAGALVQFLTPQRLMTVLDLRAGVLWYRSHKDPIMGVAFGSRYLPPAECRLSDIDRIELTTFSVPDVGVFCQVLFKEPNGSSTPIWFDASLHSAVQRFMEGIQARYPSITFSVRSD